MEIMAKRGVTCHDCQTKKKTMKLKQKCDNVICINCISSHPDNCVICMEYVRKRKVV